jgi:hypothetical protein
MVFYDNLRPKIVKLHHLETLSEISSILKLELMEHSQNTTSINSSSEAFNTAITQLWQDVQERLVYRYFHYRGKVVHTYSVERGWSGANEQAQCN